MGETATVNDPASAAALEALLERRAKRREGRRGFFRVAGGFAAGAVALNVTGVDMAAVAQAQTAPSDADVLNFALNLEYLESNFYSFAVNGTGIPSGDVTGTGTQGVAVGGPAVPFASPLVARLAAEIAQDERLHVEFLRSQLTTSAVAQPAIDLSVGPNSAFSKAAQGAGVIPPGATFNPYASDEAFLLGASLLTDVGLSAYIGSSTLISNKTYLQAAAGILAVEAYHASILRTSLYALGTAGGAVLGGTVAVSMDPFATTAAISASRAKLDGTSVNGSGGDDNGIGTAQTPTIINGDQTTSIAYGRTPAEVLNVVYLNPSAVTAGGFFPSGVNGTVNTSG